MYLSTDYILCIFYISFCPNPKDLFILLYAVSSIPENSYYSSPQSQESASLCSLKDEGRDRLFTEVFDGSGILF